MDKFIVKFSKYRFLVFVISTFGFLFLYIGADKGVIDMNHDMYGQLSVLEHFAQFLLVLSAVTFFWYLLRIISSRDNANNWQKFIFYTLPLLFLITLMPEDKLCSWLCPSRFGIFLILSYLLYFPFTLYRIVRFWFAKTKLHSVYQVLWSLLIVIIVTISVIVTLGIIY